MHIEFYAHPRCYFWSPWPVYETWPEIDYLELKGWNEIWIQSPPNW
jgi:hypothetical protein